MRLGLRIDVDTFRGTRHGVPRLCHILESRGLQASFFFTMGPDNMGRHLFRLLKPTFLRKMMRTRAGSLYGWDILLRGTIWPGPSIGQKLSAVIRETADAGHEIGVHAWDHHRWQVAVERMGATALAGETQSAFELLAEIIGKAPSCSASAGWRCTDDVLEIKSSFPFQYNSDCRGRCGPFLPLINGTCLEQPQVPVTLPTWDEVAGEVSDQQYNSFMLDSMRPDHDEVLTIHAEAEGMSKADMFEEFLDRAMEMGREIVPLGQMVGDSGGLPRRPILQGHVDGREGWVAVVGDEG